MLDDYVVALARKKTRDYPHEPHYMRVLNKNSFTLYDTLFDYYHCNLNGIESVGNVRLQATGANRLVSVYCKDTAYYVNAYSVNSSGILSLHKYYTIDTDTLPTIGDVAYNNSTGVLAVLHNIDTFGTARFYDCTAFPNITLSSSTYPYIEFVYPTGPIQTKLSSVTKTASSIFVVTGLSGNKPVFWNGNSTTCRIQRQFSMTSIESSCNRFLGATHRTTLNTGYSTFTSGFSSFMATRKCPF